MRATLESHAAKGFLPVAVTGDEVILRRIPRPVLLGEVWYADVVEVSGGMEETCFPLADFVRQARKMEPEGPARFIGHTMRCGSTLMANLVALRPDTMVLKEPYFLVSASRNAVYATGPAERESAYRLIRALVAYSAATAAMSRRALVVKLRSWIAPVVLAATRNADARWVLLWREPERVMAALRDVLPPWCDMNEEERALRTYLESEGYVAKGAPEGLLELYTGVWNATAELFSGDSGTGVAWRAMEYGSLAADAARTFHALESWFALPQSEKLPDNFDEETLRYSKGLATERFEPAGTHYRAPLSAGQREFVRRRTERNLHALRSLSADRLLLPA
ncbi:hypothetical protein [Nonomuraea rhizosphaerae]|uniref:hypothetical protein n=1 Tax=Nonomuraea rhizosphaerae TaxID=2665663 RepID=UPI001C607931|nr:hypothetical protein [Nonomuraea rhizosphaerae]